MIKHLLDAALYLAVVLASSALTSPALAASGQGLTNVYDSAGRLTSSASNVGGTARTLAYLYDANSNRTRVTH